MVDLVIDYHKKIFSENYFEFIDPNLRSNSLKNYKPTMDEIIKQILNDKMNFVEIKYLSLDDCVVRYTLLNNGCIKLSSTEPNSAHIIRLIGLNQVQKYSLELDIEIKKENLENALIEINLYANQSTNMFDFCSICGTELKLKGLNKISCCDNKEFCKTLSKHVVMDNRITDLYKKDPYLCEILIDILVEGTQHPKEEKIFKPLPLIKKITNLGELKKLIEKEQVNLNVEKISSCLGDVELYISIGSNAYAIISNAISDNYFSLSTIQNFQTELLNAGKLRLERYDENVFDTKDVKFIRLNYSYEVETKFSKEYFLFHGTPYYSWYPIVKNGLKIMSGTEFMANGAAYGNGIYLSDQFSMSLGYSSRGYNHYFNHNGTFEKNNKTRCIVGVFEISGGIEQHKKSNSVFVVSDDKIMLLRYLIVIEKNNINQQWCKELSDYFVKYLGSVNKLNEKKSITIKNKRFSAEMKLLNSNTKVANVNIVEEITNWVVELNEINGKKIKLNVYFNDYPKFPPKIILESTFDLKLKKILYDDKLNIILHEISPSGWEVTMNLSKIVNKIYECVFNSV
jgi:hypothetical protein